MQMIHPLTADMTRKLPMLPVSAVQNDANTRAVEMHLLENGTPWVIPQGVTAAVAFRKSDGSRGLYDQLPDGSSAITINGSAVTAILAPQALTCPGNVSASIVFFDGQLNRLGAFPFTIFVESDPSAGQGISNDYYRFTTMEQVSDALEDFLAKAEEALAVVHDTATQDAPAMVCEASGEIIAVADASNRPLAGLSIYGKTTQNGTPAPSAPIPLESVGESIGVTVLGKNLLAYTKDNLHLGSSTTPVVNGTNNVSAVVCVIGIDKIYLTGDYSLTNAEAVRTGFFMAYPKVGDYGDAQLTYASTILDVSKYNYVLFSWSFAGTSGTADAVKNSFMCSLEANAQYEYPTAQTATFSAPNGLHGIGEVCDEIDFERGVRVQRFDEVDMGTLTLQYVDVVKQFFVHLPTGKPMKEVPNNLTAINAICSAYPVAPFNSRDNYDFVISSPSGVYSNVRLNDIRYGMGQEAEMKASLSGVKLVYELATPIETPLTAEELASFAALHTHKPNTTVFNDSGADMDIAYVADTKTYIDQKLAAISAAILNG